MQTKHIQEVNCCSCKKFLDSPHVLLPCYHTFCQYCSLGKYLGQCIKCDQGAKIEKSVEIKEFSAALEIIKKVG
jgi:hypothetical protein